MTNYKVTYRYKNDKKEHETIIMESSGKLASRKVEEQDDDIIIIDVREDLPTWGDSLIGKTIKWGFKKIIK